jgi:hypothetical protein
MTDPWYRSKRLLAAVVLVLSTLAGLFGYEVDALQQAGIVEAIATIGAAVAGLLVVWSKVKEKRKL